MTTQLDLEITESAATMLPLTREQAVALRAIGRRLAWGGNDQNSSADESDRTLIECATTDGVNWRVRVANAVGVVGLPGARLNVRPKIPLDHLIFLLRLGGSLPKTAPATVPISNSQSLQDVLASWYLHTLESLIRGGLRSFYVLERSELTTLRGRMDAPRSAIAVAIGQLRFPCEFEEFTVDTPLNRILAAAARLLGRNRVMRADLRRRARVATYHMEGIGPLQPADLRAEPDRTSARYIDAIALARLVLAGLGTGVDSGPTPVSSFLLPTPLPVENALRALAAESLAPSIAVTKGRRRLTGTSLTVNPDLLLGDSAIGDVKYKVWEGSWVRADLYQLIAFAVAYQRQVALHVGFGGQLPTNPLRVGDIDVWRVRWDSRIEVSAEEASKAFKDEIRQWWHTVSSV